MWKSEWPVLHRLASDQLAWLKHKSTRKAAFLFLCVCLSLTLISQKSLRFREKLERERERERENGRVQDRTLTVGDIFFRAISTHTVSTLCYLTVSPFQFIFFCLSVCLFLRRKMRNGFWCVMGCDLNFKWRDVRVIPESHWSFDFLFVSMKTLFLAKTFT